MLIFKTLALQPLHGWVIAKRIRQIDPRSFAGQAGIVVSVLRRLEQQGWIRGGWREREDNRRATYYSLTKASRRRSEREAASWQRVSAAILALVVNEVYLRLVDQARVDWRNRAQFLTVAGQGFSDAEVDAASEVRRQVWNYLASGAGFEQAKSSLEQAKTKRWYGALTGQRDDSAGSFRHSSAHENNWYKTEMNYDPEVTMRRLKVPALFLFGGADQPVNGAQERGGDQTNADRERTPRFCDQGFPGR